MKREAIRKANSVNPASIPEAIWKNDDEMQAIYDTKGEKFYNDIAGIDTAEMPDFDLLTGGFPCQSYPEKKNIPKNRNKWHRKGKGFRENRDKILSYFKPERFILICSVTQEPCTYTKAVCP